jgi:DNA-binding CsgD family transcriptional regulator
MRGRDPVILERDKELATLAAAIAGASTGHGTFVLVEGPAGIGKTTLLRAACQRPAAAEAQVLTGRGLALERDFPYGIVRQLIEPVRAAATPQEWAGLLDGAAGLAARVFDWAGTPTVEDDTPYAVTHGLYWLAANLAAGRPLVIAVDDGHWADTASLRWLTHLAQRIEDVPVVLLMAVRTAPGEPALLADLRASPACQLLRLPPLTGDAAAMLIRQRFGPDAAAELCSACHASTGGNPFLLESLAAALRAADAPPAGLAAQAASLGPEQVARFVRQRVDQIGAGASGLARALAVFGGPARLRHAAALAGLDLRDAARLADSLRAADVLAPGSMLEFGHPIVRAAIYESILPGERALAHGQVAQLLDADGADAERQAPHLLRSEPAGDQRVVAVLREAARAASGRGSPGTAADYLRRALDEPPGPAARPAVLLDLGLSLAGERSPASAGALRDAVQLATCPAEHATAALLTAEVLGIWGHHDAVTGICLDAFATGDSLDPVVRGNLEAELFANSICDPSMASKTLASARRQLAEPGASSRWRVLAAFAGTVTGRPASEALDRLAPVLAAGLGDIPPDSLTAAFSLMVLIWTDEFGTASRICDAVLHSARERGSMSMVAHASCSRSMLMRRLGYLEDAAEDGQLALDFKLATSPPVAVAWAAAACIDALTGLGRLGDADAVAAVAAQRNPPPGWIHTVMFRQARGGLRLAQQRYDEALDDLNAAAAGWQVLGVDNPSLASWRTDAAAVHAARGDARTAAGLAREQLALARRAGTPRTVGIALRAHAAAVPGRARENLAEAVALLETAQARYDLAGALLDLGSQLRRAGHPQQARPPLRRALDLAQRTGAAPLAGRARQELLAAGARPRRTALTGPDALTSAERRVTALAADGLSNRQIAQHLFITQATVETHLRHAFHKLGITSRASLPRLAPFPADPATRQPAGLLS